MENLLQCKGKKFKANIYNIPVEGRIQVEEGSIYLCQNVKDGADCEDKLGFKCSWHIEDGSEMALIKNNASNLCIHPSTKEEAESFKDWQVGDKLVYESNTWEVISVVENWSCARERTAMCLTISLATSFTH